MDIRTTTQWIHPSYDELPTADAERADDAMDRALATLAAGPDVTAAVAALAVSSARQQRDTHAAMRARADAVERAEADAQSDASKRAADATRLAGIVGGAADIAGGVTTGVAAGYRFAADRGTNAAAVARDTRTSAAFGSAREAVGGSAHVAGAILDGWACEDRAAAAAHEHAAARASRSASDARDAEAAADASIARALAFLRDVDATQAATLGATLRRA